MGNYNYYLPKEKVFQIIYEVLLQNFFWKLIFFLLIFSIFLNQIFEKLNQKYWNFN